jgi:hypothetical protein
VQSRCCFPGERWPPHVLATSWYPLVSAPFGRVTGTGACPPGPFNSRLLELVATYLGKEFTYVYMRPGCGHS